MTPAARIANAMWVIPISIWFTSCSPPEPTTGARPDVRQAGGQSRLQFDVEDSATPRDDQSLPNRIDAILARERTGRMMHTEVNAAWQIFHGVIPYGFDLEIETPDRGVMSALDYAFSGGQINGFEIQRASQAVPATGRPGVVARLEPGSYVGQGHPDQWLAILAMAGIPLSTELQVGSHTATVEDWARQAQYDVPNNPLDEFSWTLIALTHYFPDEPTWTAAGNRTLRWELLVEAELAYDLNESACGGTHRLAGITRAVQAKQRLGLPDSPVWEAAEKQVNQSLREIEQGRDGQGRLSSYYLVRPGATVDSGAELASTGHLFEFAALALPAERLHEAWVRRAGHRVCDILDASVDVELDSGSLYHALNGLKLYRSRVSDS